MSLEVGRPLLSYTWLPPGGYQSSINIVTNNKQQLCTHLKENWNNHRYLDQNSSSNKSLGLQVSHHSHHNSLCENNWVYSLCKGSDNWFSWFMSQYKSRDQIEKRLRQIIQAAKHQENVK